MALLLHLSDTHFGTEVAPVVAALTELVRQRLPDVLVWSGDVTQRARRGEFARARAFGDALVQAAGGARLLVMPGNHDIPLWNLPARLFWPYRNYLRAFGPRLESRLDTDDFLIVGVNTTRPGRHIDGEVSPAQVEQVSRLLAAGRPWQLRIVVTHQPAEVLRAEDAHDRLHGAEPALQAWSRAGCDLVLGGHIHLPYALALHQRPHVPTARPAWVVQAGTAVSARVRHGTNNSVNLLHWRPAGPGAARLARLERCDWDARLGRFVTASEQVLALGPEGSAPHA